MALYERHSGFMMATTDKGLVPYACEESWDRLSINLYHVGLADIGEATPESEGGVFVLADSMQDAVQVAAAWDHHDANLPRLDWNNIQELSGVVLMPWGLIQQHYGMKRGNR